MKVVWSARGLGLLGCIATLPVAFASLGCDTNPTAASTAGAVALDPAANHPIATTGPVLVQLKAGTVRIPNALHPLARPELDAGRLAPERRIENVSLFFKPSRDQKADRDALVKAQLDPTSPHYHEWLTPEEYAARFGASASDIARATAWLKAQGLDVHRTSRLGTRVTFSGRVADLEAAFQTEMHSYVVGGETHYAMATAPAVPDDLAGVVLAVYNAHDFYARPVSGKTNLQRVADRKPNYELSIDGGGPDGSLLSFDLLSPPDWAAAYDVAKLYEPGIGGTKLDGTGVTIGIVGTADIAQSDIDAFRKTFNLPATTITKTLVPDTGVAAGGRFGNGIEAILDVEWSGGIAKGATVNYVFVGESDRNVDDATFYLIEENLTPIVSESYGGCEAGSLPTDADVLEENGTAANLMGITYMAAAGDDGAEDCGGGPFGSGLYVDLPGAYPGVTSVGGTQFPSPVGWNDQNELTAYPPLEQVWNESDDPYSMFGIGAGGGGISTVFARPDYQASIKTCLPVGSLPVPENTSRFRQVPDVALSAASATPGYFIECTVGPTGDCSNTGGLPQGSPVGGTSAATPSFSGVVAILDQAVGERLGNINPLLYSLEAKKLSASPFHDITSGNNEVACGPAGAGDAGGPGDAGWGDAGCGPSGLFGFQATAGYDCASGIGSIDGYNLVNALIGVAKTTTALTVSPIQTTEGGQVTLDATVSTVGAAQATIGGDVTFTFESFTPTGEIDLSWELGTVPLTAGSGGMGTASLKTAIPPGLVKATQQWVDVIAVYGGDTAHLTSTSPKVGVAFATLNFAISPAMTTMPPDGMKTFTTTGGIPPVRWYVEADTTHGRTEAGFGAADIDEQKGALVVGPKDGYVEIVAIDSEGAEALSYITVGMPDGGAPWAGDAGPFLEGGVAPLIDGGPEDSGAGASDGGNSSADSGSAAVTEAGPDGGFDANLPSKSNSNGCNCTTAGGAGDANAMAGLAGLLLGATLLVQRRRRRGA